MEPAVHCVGLSHVYSMPSASGHWAPPASLLSEAIAAAQQQQQQQQQQKKRHKTESGAVSPQTPNPKPFSLNNITFDIPQGARVLLVGSNGAGKSTLMSLIGGQMVSPAPAPLGGLQG